MLKFIVRVVVAVPCFGAGFVAAQAAVAALTGTPIF